jgi:Amt family ammonium transporter
MNSGSACLGGIESPAVVQVSIGMVLMMTPALALFEAGLLRAKNAVSIMMQCWTGMIVLTILWYLFGYSLSLGPDHGGFIGDFSYGFFKDVEILCANGAGFEITGTVFATFQGMFAAITPLLITGAFSERVPFGSFLVFICLWSILIYYPLCHWVWGNGWLAKLKDGHGTVDFAGGASLSGRLPVDQPTDCPRL